MLSSFSSHRLVKIISITEIYNNQLLFKFQSIIKLYILSDTSVQY